MQALYETTGSFHLAVRRVTRLGCGAILVVLTSIGWSQTAQAQHTLSVSPPFANALGEPTDEDPIAVTVTVSGSATMQLDYRVAWLSRTWFTLDKSTGTIPAGGSDTFEVYFNPFGLAPGTYAAQLNVENVTFPGDAVVLPLTLSIGEAGIGSVMLLPDEDVEVNGAAGYFSGNDVQSSTLVNASDRAVLWRAVVSDSWISVSPEGGELAPSGQPGGIQRLEIRVNAAANDLPAGSHVATVAFENISAGVPPISFGEISAAIPIGTRLIRVVAWPVLTLGSAFEGGSVSVDPNDSRLSEGAQGQFVFDKGQAVTLTATPEDGFLFTGWISDVDEDLSSNNPLVLAMDVSRTISASFAPIRRALTLSTTGVGTGTVSRSPTGAVEDSDLSAMYNDGTVVTLKAQENPGSRFAGWVGNVPARKGHDNPIRVNMNVDRTIAARFEPLITLTVDVADGGLVEIEPDLAAYEPGATVILTALPDDGEVFLGWGGDADGAEMTLVVTLDESLDIQALFGSDDADAGSGGFLLEVEIVGDGTVTPDGGSFKQGELVMLIATPGVGSSFVEWAEDAGGTELTTTILMDGDRTVKVVFDSSSEPAGQALVRGGASGGSSSSSLCGSTGMLGLPMFGLGLMSLVRSRRRAAVVQGKQG